MIEAKRIGDHSFPVPKQETHGAAGFDLASTIEARIYPGAYAMIPTGWAIQIPFDFVGMVCPRSGLALKHGITVLNAPGIIDSDYTGEVKVLLVNHGERPFDIKPGDRIAQLVVAGYVRGLVKEVSRLSRETVRGDGGFGSTN